MSVDAFFVCLHGGIQFHSFASDALLCQTPFCQTAPLLPSVTQQQNVMEYWEGSASTAIPPTPTSDIMGQHNKIGGTTFGAALDKGKINPVKSVFWGC